MEIDEHPCHAKGIPWARGPKDAHGHDRRADSSGCGRMPADAVESEIERGGKQRWIQKLQELVTWTPVGSSTQPCVFSLRRSMSKAGGLREAYRIHEYP